MTDKPKAPSDPHHVLPTFVNLVVGSGNLGAVFNLTFATFQFTPSGSADKPVDDDPIITCRLRMDLNCLVQLRDACNGLIEKALKPANGTTH